MFRTQIIYLVFLISMQFSCGTANHLSNNGIIQLKTLFYNEDGRATFTHYFKIWYKDSMAIEEITGVNSVTDTANITTVTYPLIKYRFIDLRSESLYDYKNFSDTASIIHKSPLPDSLMLDCGWSFYSQKAPTIQGISESLTDTVIGNLDYKRVKFNFTGDDPTTGFLIGYFRCDGKGDMFSIEKNYSKKINCTMVKYFDYKIGMARPFASKEVFYISDTLTKHELKVFEAWEKNAKQNPIKK